MTSVVADRHDITDQRGAHVTYRAGLDGLRAIAVVLVLLFHLGHLDGGNLGVDLFFAISGWLITWRLLHEHDRAGTIVLGNFWSARLRRLMPAALLVIASVLVVWPIAGISVPSLRRDALFATFWASNWGTISGGGDYWARFGEPSPLTHFWSLAIEEQFYLVWPLLVVGLLVVTRRRRPRAAVIALALGLAAMSIVRLVTTFDVTDPTATYMNTFTRAHSLLIGAAAGAYTVARPTTDRPLALRGGRFARRAAPFAALALLAMVLTSSKESTWLFRWGFPTFALAATVVVVAVADGAWAGTLARRPLRWIGDRSYGIYLWHWPVFLLLDAERSPLDGPLLDIVRVALAIGLADVSYRLVEQPIRRRRRLTDWRGPVVAVAGLAAVTTLALTVPIPAAPTDGASEVTLPPAQATEPTATQPAATTAPTGTEPSTSSGPSTEPSATGGSTPTVSSPATSRPATSTPATSAPEPSTTPAPAPRAVRVLVAGDSTAVHLADVLVPYSAAHSDEVLAGSAAFPGCGLSAFDDGRLHEMTENDGRRTWIDLSGCVASWDSVARRVASEERYEVVLMSIGPWDGTDIRLADGRVVSVLDPVGAALVARRYQSFVAQVEAAGARVMWITPPDVVFQWGAVDSPLSNPARWAALRSIIDALPVEQIDLPGWLAANGLDGPEGRPDGVHLAPEVEQRFVNEVIVPTIMAAPGG